MTWGLFLAILAFIAAFAAALKALPVIWASLKKTIAFLQGLVEASTLGEVVLTKEDILEKFAESADIIKEVRDEIETLRKQRSEEFEMVNSFVTTIENLSEDIDEYVFRVATIVFSQIAYNEDNAFYVIRLNQDGEWVFTSANKAYYNLTGLTPGMTASGQYFDSIALEDRERVEHASFAAGDAGVVFEAQYKNVNLKTGKETEVEIHAEPIKNKSGELQGYLGVIKKIDA